MIYLDLVNKVLEESGKEQTLLDYSTWDDDLANRRLYPRVKRLVREAWRMLQLSRNEWEFNTGSTTLTLYPSIKYSNMEYTNDMYLYEWVGEKSGVRLQVNDSIPDYDSQYNYGSGIATVAFIDVPTLPVMYEKFVNDIGESFIYVGPGSYSINFDKQNRIREPRWETLHISTDNQKYSRLPVMAYTAIAGRGGQMVAAKDNVGRLFINNQLTSAFSLRFDFDMAPQTLEAGDDEPEGLPEEYHDWIAWEALANLARYDKDPILLTYAQSMSDVYKRRAERNLLPPITWQPSIYNKGW
jgi:hypothetical protein